MNPQLGMLNDPLQAVLHSSFVVAVDDKAEDEDEDEDDEEEDSSEDEYDSASSRRL